MSSSPLRSTPPAVVIVCAAVVVVTMIGSVTALAAFGQNTDPVFKLINILIGAVNMLISASAVLYAGAAAKSAGTAVEQTNGVMDSRIEEGVKKALETHNVATKQDVGAQPGA